MLDAAICLRFLFVTVLYDYKYYSRTNGLQYANGVCKFYIDCESLDLDLE